MTKRSSKAYQLMLSIVFLSDNWCCVEKLLLSELQGKNKEHSQSKVYSFTDPKSTTLSLFAGLCISPSYLKFSLSYTVSLYEVNFLDAFFFQILSLFCLLYLTRLILHWIMGKCLLNQKEYFIQLDCIMDADICI